MHYFAWPMRPLSETKRKLASCGIFESGGDLLQRHALFAADCVDSGCGFGEFEGEVGRVEESAADVVDVYEIDDLIAGRHIERLSRPERVEQ